MAIEVEGAPTGMIMQAIKEWDVQRLDVPPGWHAVGDGGAGAHVRSLAGVRVWGREAPPLGGLVCFGVVLRSQWPRHPRTTQTRCI
mmetsp:Transcript_6126/g.13414  ORF Transcript_6126/g.13414 Transcript_6126/m.13414 type:complete len:86 (-) Transcript_6126:19-276(-)